MTESQKPFSEHARDEFTRIFGERTKDDPFAIPKRYCHSCRENWRAKDSDPCKDCTSKPPYFLTGSETRDFYSIDLLS